MLRVESGRKPLAVERQDGLAHSLVKILRLAFLLRTRFGYGLLAVTLCSGFPGCANHGATSGGTRPDNVAISRSQYDAEGHGFEESWPFGPLRNSAAGDFR
ncbi:MAG TPA: hypothetical protein VGD78_23775 [Chthoniobacterales bacterium]